VQAFQRSHRSTVLGDRTRTIIRFNINIIIYYYVDHSTIITVQYYYTVEASSRRNAIRILPLVVYVHTHRNIIHECISIYIIMYFGTLTFARYYKNTVVVVCLCKRYYNNIIITLYLVYAAGNIIQVSCIHFT